MSELELIQSALERAANRRRWARGLRAMWKGLFAGAILSLLIVGAYHLFPLPLISLYLATIIPLPCMAAGLLIGWWPKPRPEEIARWLDARQQLRERLSTALEMALRPVDDPWRNLVLRDAAAHVTGLDPRALIPFRLPPAIRWSLVILALTAALCFVPEYRGKAYVARQNDQQRIKEAGRRLAGLTKRNLQNRAPALQPTVQALKSAQELGNKLEKAGLTRDEALKDLANVSDKLKEQLNTINKNPDIDRLREAAGGPSAADAQTLAGLQKQIADLQKELGNAAASPDALDKARKDLAKLKEAAKGLAGESASAASAAQSQSLARSAAALSRQMQAMGLQMPKLDEAIAALEANQADLALKDLQDATVDLDKLRDMANTLRQLQAKADQIGKDLAEQLKNGQPEVAAQTLQKMKEQLQSSNLSKEDLQKVMDEISKAIPPAGNYGKVAGHLKDAQQAMKNAQNGKASDALAKAADELQKMAQQMGDARQLMAALGNLNQASASIGQGKRWSEAASAGQKGWQGVEGTAADPNLWLNSGSYSMTSGGDPSSPGNGWGLGPRTGSVGAGGKLTDKFESTKVKGQFSAGASMPSITLKGVSIKGASKVELEAATTAAQSDAQSALNQEKVPRAYQGAVRDYFNELEK
ncbi:MAG TPA: hypothetical protein VHH88_03640 [Verrucomicrobiae bacterium]|nr:hypothetical protein [Verrucomicrobiae bacterium]